MTSPTSPPNRRRRRIVVAIAVLVLGLAWWLWPRVDQRFVGTWLVVSDHKKFQFGGEAKLVLSGNGFGVANPGGEFPVLFRWSHEGNKIRLEHYEENGHGSYVLARLASYPALRRWLKNTPPIDSSEFTVFNVTEQSLRMKDTTPGMFSPEPWDPRPLDFAALEFRRVE